MKVKTQLPRLRILVILLISLQVSVISAGLSLKFPFITFQKPQQQQHHHHHQPQKAHQHQPQQVHQQEPQPHDHHHHHGHQHNVLDHAHVDQTGTLYLHDPESTVKFYYTESLHGPSNRVDIHDDGCREVPMDYWYNIPKSLWAKHCITIYQSGHCKGEGVQVAGMVTELRSAGMHYGVNSFKPCEKNIRIRFMPAGDHKHHHHHHQ